MSRIVDCEPWHLIYVACRSPQWEREGALMLGLDVQTLAARRATETGVRFTIIDNAGQPRVCFGIANTGVPGVGYMWMFRDENAATFVKTGAKAFKQILKANEYRRIEATTRASCEQCAKFLEWLGFKLEGTKRGYFVDGVDMHQFAIVR